MCLKEYIVPINKNNKKMKKKYIIPAQKWAIMEDCYLQSLSVVNDTFAKEDAGMDVKAQEMNRSNLWDNEW